jgi:trigger factor
MQVSVENVSKLERRLTVRFPAEQVESRVRERIRELGQTVRIKGFRPGKVPARVIEQRFGQQVRNEAMSDVVRSSFEEAVRQQNLRPAVAPSIQANPTGNAQDIEYVATFEVVPELGPIDVSSLEVSRPQAEVTDADVSGMIETLRLQRRQWSPVERAAQAGDMVLFEYAAQSGDVRHPAEGMDRVGTVLGSSALFPQFEASLTGITAGEHRTIELDFPADFRESSLAGRHATVQVHAIRVQESNLPALDEAFAASFGVREGGLERFRTDVRANLDRELRGALRARLKRNVVERLVAAHQDFEVPRSMCDAEARGMLMQARQQAERAGATPPDSAAPFQLAAERRVRAFLLLNEVARQNKIAVDQRRVADMLASIASTYEEPEKVVELYSKDAELMSSLRNSVLEDQVVDWIAEHARAGEEQLSFDQVMKPQG